MDGAFLCFPKYTIFTSVLQCFTTRGAFGFAVSQGTDAVQHLTGFMDRFPGPKKNKIADGYAPSMITTWKMRISPPVFWRFLVEILHLRFHISFGWGTWSKVSGLIKPSNRYQTHQAIWLTCCTFASVWKYQQPNKGLRNDPFALIRDIYEPYIWPVSYMNHEYRYSLYVYV